MTDGAGSRTLQDARVIPHLQDVDAPALVSYTPTLPPLSMDAVAAAAVAVAVDSVPYHPAEDNITVHQGSATTVDTGSRNHTRFDRVPSKSHENLYIRESSSVNPQQEEANILLDHGGGLIGSGDVDTNPKGFSLSGNRGPDGLMTSSSSSNGLLQASSDFDHISSGSPHAGAAMPAPPEEMGLTPVASVGDGASLLKTSNGPLVYSISSTNSSNGPLVNPKSFSNPHVYPVTPSSPASSHLVQHYNPPPTDYNALGSQHRNVPLAFEPQNMKYSHHLYGEKYSPYSSYKHPNELGPYGASAAAVAYDPLLMEEGNFHHPPPPFPPPQPPNEPFIPPAQPQINEAPLAYDPIIHPVHQEQPVAEDPASLPSQGHA
ncbi:hypothetical protein SK128_017493, partial [Halocaridina rubra]